MLQSAPKLGSAIVIDWLLNERLPFELVEDLQLRADHGRQKHGTYLMANNGRNSVIDMYQELLDAIFYCAQSIMEGKDNLYGYFRTLTLIANGLRRSLENT